MPRMSTPLPKCLLCYPISSNGVDNDEFCHTVQFESTRKFASNRYKTSDKACNVILKTHIHLHSQYLNCSICYPMNSNAVDSNGVEN